ncbi:MAG: DUF983 domain-containing protein [Acidimicrobiia bacterium]|nr:DUF983 domain-containing protein [Acidimicrobiia bacterium]
MRRLRMAETCPGCQHRFERHEGYWIGAVAINTVATLGVFAAAFVGAMVATWPDPPWTAITIGAVILNVIFPIVFYPWSKTIWVALEVASHQSPVTSRQSPQSSVVSLQSETPEATSFSQDAPRADD